MGMDLAGSVDAPPGNARWTVAFAWLFGLSLYCIAILLATEAAAVWINDIAWTVASGAAAALCFHTSRLVEPARRRAWLLFALASGCWFLGQLHWNYSTLVLDTDVPFPSFAQVFFLGFPILTIAGVLQLPESRASTFTFKHVGNIGLVSCCLVGTVVLAVLEPARQTNTPLLHLWIQVPTTLLIAGVLLVGLYALWTYRWGSSWTPMLLLVIGLGVYAVADIVYAHSLLTGSYCHQDLVNGSWVAMFGFIASAAHAQSWLTREGRIDPPERMLARERWLEAVVPALLIIAMVIVAVGSSATLTPRVIWMASGIFVLFALVLGAREAWIQNESQQLTDKLLAANEQLQQANHELRLSEARYRELNAALEQRVSDRTTELKRAYDELEGFSYAVAHDLKSPLRAINGFAHLLEAEMDAQLTGRARDHVTRIRNGAVRMAKLIDDLLAYSHIDRRGLEPRVVSLAALIESVVAQYLDEIQRRGIAVHLDVEPLKLRIDNEGLRLALRNLMENAIKYTRERTDPRIEIGARAMDHGVRLKVADNGIGFGMEYHDHIFKIFQRLHRDDQYPGTGIGLALVRKAVERLGGRVWAESQAGHGATFWVELPRSVMT